MPDQYKCGCCPKVFKGYNAERDAHYCCKEKKAVLVEPVFSYLEEGEIIRELLTPGGVRT